MAISLTSRKLRNTCRVWQILCRTYLIESMYQGCTKFLWQWWQFGETCMPTLVPHSLPAEDFPQVPVQDIPGTRASWCWWQHWLSLNDWQTIVHICTYSTVLVELGCPCLKCVNRSLNGIIGHAQHGVQTTIHIVTVGPGRSKCSLGLGSGGSKYWRWSDQENGGQPTIVGSRFQGFKESVHSKVGWWLREVWEGSRSEARYIPRRSNLSC